MRKLKLIDETDIVTVADKLDEFIDSKRIAGVAPATIRAYSNLLNCCNLDLSASIHSIDWNKYYLQIRGKECSETTKNTYLRNLKIFVQYVNKTEGTEFPVPVIRKVDTCKELYTDDELKKLIAKPKRKDFVEYRNWCTILLVLDTGMRAGSIRNILIKDIDLIHNTVYLRHTKTNKIQTLPFSTTTSKAIQTLVKAIKSSLGDDDNNYLFPTIEGNMMAENALYCAIANYNKSRGVSKTSLHLLRHNFARAWVINGGSEFGLQMMLGHSGLEMTRHYCQIYSTDLIRSYKSPVEMLQSKQIKMASN